ncbi:MAG TPA: acyloxyacyl hydrolase [Bacteroidia bacterium]|nr:acyloxyacyl hydrolase [Bacteroidia bacterium]
MRIVRLIACVFSLIFYVGGFRAAAQASEKTVEGGMLFGSAIRNYPEFPPLKGPAVLAYVKYSAKLNGAAGWHKYYRYPFLGFRMVGGSLGNNAVLGQLIGGTVDIRIPGNENKKINFSPVLGMGASWFSKPYNETSNPENFVIGSAITFFATAAAEMSYKLKPSMDLVLSVNVLHASNAHFQLPNVGLNLPAVGLGFRYRFSEKTDTVASPVVLAATDTKPHLNIRFSVGFNEQGDSQGPVNGPKYPIFLASTFASKKVSPVNKLKAGIEVWYNSGVYDYIVSQEFYDTHEHRKSFAVAAMFGHEFLLGHWGVVTDAGLYLYNKFYQDKFKETEETNFRQKLKTYVPGRIGFQYYLNDAITKRGSNAYVGIYIKSNMGQADFLESGFGISF